MASIYNLKKKPINTIPKVIWEMNAETYQVKHTNVSTPPIHTTIHPTHLKPHTYTPYTRTHTHIHIDTPHAHTHIPVHNTTHTYTQRQRSDRHSVL